MMALSLFCFTLYAYFMASFSPLLGSADYQSIIPAERICKPGPQLKASLDKTNCLVIGDSISIGYTPWVIKMLGDNYQVQHAPWDVIDGGALDSKYGLQCLDMFLQTSMLEPTTYDVIIFNFGMHDINFSGKSPEEYVEPDEYAENLRSIASILLSTGAKVGFVLTTPVPFSVTLNNRVKQYNRLADAVMKTFPTVVTADLYTWVTDACGEPPYESCIIAREQPSPHYTQPGYEYLSIRVKDLILDLVRGIDQNAHHFRPQQTARGNPVTCEDKSGKVLTVCPYNSTCCDSLFSVTGKGCCLHNPEAIPCNDGKHCCPAGYECESSCSVHRCSCVKAQIIYIK